MHQATLFRVGTCVECGLEFVAGRTGRVAKRCKKCAKERDRAAQRRWQSEHYVRVIVHRECVECGASYDAPGRDTKSSRCPECRPKRRAQKVAEWAEAHPDKVYRAKRKWHEANREHVKWVKHSRRVLERGGSSERFTRQQVFDRDGWVCQICGERLRTDVNPLDNAAPTIDHIVPVARGGSHTLDNVQAACFGCNRSKGPRLLAGR